MTAQPRLRGFLFSVRKPDGSREDVVFYATRASIALKYARAWAEARGFQVFLVVGEART